MSFNKGFVWLPILLVIIAVFAVSGGTYYVMHKNTAPQTPITPLAQPMTNTPTQTTPTQTLETTTQSNTPVQSSTDQVSQVKFSSTVSAVLNKNTDEQCTFSTTLANPYAGNKLMTYSGTLFSSGQKFRVDRSASDPGAENHTIFDGTYLYNWLNGGAFKVNVQTYLSSATRQNGKLLDSINLTRVYQFICKPFSDDQSVFVPPASVIFTELKK